MEPQDVAHPGLTKGDMDALSHRDRLLPTPGETVRWIKITDPPLRLLKSKMQPVRRRPIQWWISRPPVLPGPASSVATALVPGGPRSQVHTARVSRFRDATPDHHSRTSRLPDDSACEERGDHGLLYSCLDIGVPAIVAGRPFNDIRVDRFMMDRVPRTH